MKILKNGESVVIPAFVFVREKPLLVQSEDEHGNVITMGLSHIHYWLSLSGPAGEGILDYTIANNSPESVNYAYLFTVGDRAQYLIDHQTRGAEPHDPLNGILRQCAYVRQIREDAAIQKALYEFAKAQGLTERNTPSAGA